MNVDRRARADLHLHSDRSDGAFPPHEVLARCAQAGLDVVALTDHDLAGGLGPGPHAVGGRTVRVIAGAEVTATHDGREFHLLVYFPDEPPERFLEFCRAQCAERAQRYATAVANLGVPGLHGPDADAREGRRAVTRLHLARALVALGRATHVGEAFSRWLGDGHGVVPPIALTLLDAVAFARSCGGVTSLAHPSVRDAEALLPTLAAAGLHGVEAHRPALSGNDRRRLRRLAQAHGLFLTGGSDWHGWHGERLGLFAVPGDELEALGRALQAA